jgi:hypothetical protein
MMSRGTTLSSKARAAESLCDLRSPREAVDDY